jgi:hypothetical protein
MSRTDQGHLRWHITPDLMAYYTVSQVLPVGARSTARSRRWPRPDGAQFEKPHGYASDSPADHPRA